MFNRRMIMGAALAAGASSGLPAVAHAQAETPGAAPARKKVTLERLAEAAVAHRHALAFDGTRFSGPGWNWIVDEGRRARHFLFGEDHGYAEIAKLSAAIAVDLAPAGYSRAAIEISPPMAAEVDAALAAGGVAGLRAYFDRRQTQVAFYSLREEAEALAEIHAAFRGPGRRVHGLDYEVFADRRLIERLWGKRPRGRAAEALRKLDEASAESWAEYRRTRNPGKIFCFSGDPALVAAVRQAWPRADGEAAEILETLQQSLEINRLWMAGKGYQSNHQRSGFMRANLARTWKDGRPASTFFKFGGSHVVRGLNFTDVYDLGALAAEAAALEGSSTFHLMAIGGAGAVHAVFNPVKLAYEPAPVDLDGLYGFPELARLALPQGYTVFDLRPLRPVIAGNRAADVSPTLLRLVHGFDALVVMPGATASVSL